jgi:sugar lactone lactonase YvrE
MERWEGELVSDARAHLGEGPLWDARTGELLWVDILAGVVHRLDPVTGVDRAFEVGRPVGAVGLRAAGGYVLALQDGFAVSDGVETHLVAPVEVDRPELRMNDGACDSRGRFWAGTMEFSEENPAGTVYRLDASHAVEPMLTGVTVSNGIAWSPDDALLYYIDSPTRGVDVFAFEPDAGTISGRRRLVTVGEGEGFPDGLVVDAEGCLWVALWEGWAVHRYDPDGALVGVVDIPVARVTKPAFGGPELADLYVTTAAPDAPDPKQPNAGGVFVARPGVRGLPPHAYLG